MTVIPLSPQSFHVEETAWKYTGNLSHHSCTVNLCFPLQLDKILTGRLSMSEFIQRPKSSTSKLHCTVNNNFCGKYKAKYNMNREYSVF